MKTFNKTTAMVACIITFVSTSSPGKANEITKSFERDLSRPAVTSSKATLTRDILLPTQDAVNRTVWTREDQVRKSFERDLNHEKPVHNKPVNRKVDPVATTIRNKISAQLGNK